MPVARQQSMFAASQCNVRRGRAGAIVRAAIEPLEARRLMAVDLVSVATGGGSADGPSGEASVSSSGQFVAFSSTGSNLVNGDANNTTDIFVRDRTGNSTALVSANAGNTGPGNGKSYAPAISADGRYVAFVSEASDLVDGDTNSRPDVFIRNLAANTTRLVTRSQSGGFGNGFSGEPAISADGRFVSFTSSSTNLTVLGDTNNRTDIFVRDMGATETPTGGTTKVVSANADNTLAGNDVSFDASISADGRYIAFRSKATNIGGTISTPDKINVFLRDTNGTGSTELISVNAAGTSGSDDSTSSSVSANGQFVVFRSVASDLTDKDNNNTDDVFLRNAGNDTTTLLSINRQRTASGRGRSEFPSVSSDGHFAAFASFAPDLVEVDANGREDVFLRDLQAGPITLLSATPGGTAANGNSFDPFVSTTGQFVVFTSDASDLAAGDGNSANDVFVTGTPQAEGDSIAPTAIVSTTQNPASTGGAEYDFNVDLADNVALNTVSVGNLTVTPPGGGAPIAATLMNVLGSGRNATAVYRIAAPGGTIDRADDGTYTVNMPAGAVKDVAGNAAAAGAIGTFALAAADPNSPDLTVAFVGSQPDAVIGGKASKAKVTVKNVGVNATASNVKVNLYLSDNDTYDAGDREVATKTLKNLKLKTNKSKSVGFSFKYPADIGDGGYVLIARADADNGIVEFRENNNTANSVGKGGAPVALKQPFVDLNPIEVSRPFGTLAANGKAIASMTVQNLGNVKFSGDMAIRLLASNNPDTVGDDVVVYETTKRVTIANGKSKKTTYKFTFPGSVVAGNYELIGEVDPANSVVEGEETNNSAKSAGFSLT